ADPGTLELGVFRDRQDSSRGLEEPENTGDGRPFVEAYVLDRCSQQHRAIVPRNEIATGAPRDAAERGAGPAEGQQLTSNGVYRRRDAEAIEMDLAGPTAGGQHHATTGHDVFLCRNDRVRPALRNRAYARWLEHPRAAPDRRFGQRVRQLRRRDIGMGGYQ